MAKAIIIIPDEEIKDCKKCRFYKYYSVHFGRKSGIECILTGYGDQECDNTGEETRAIQRMRKHCLFLKHP